VPKRVKRKKRKRRKKNNRYQYNEDTIQIKSHREEKPFCVCCCTLLVVRFILLVFVVLRLVLQLSFDLTGLKQEKNEMRKSVDMRNCSVCDVT
jgi:hypothetical protein